MNEKENEKINQNKEYLGKKKLRIEELIRNNKKDLNLSDQDDEESEEEIEMKHYKNAISGKLNIKNIFSSKINIEENANISLEKKTELKNVQDNKNSDKNTSNYSLTSKLLNLLPTAKKNLKDKFQIIPKLDFTNSVDISDKFKKLANPDAESDIDKNNDNNFSNNNIYTGNLVEVNVNDQMDSNWEIKYLTKLQKQERNEINEATPLQTNKNHIKSLISDYKKKEQLNELEEENVSKYSKVNTRSKYGW